jgi:hypothetical protein
LFPSTTDAISRFPAGFANERPLVPELIATHVEHLIPESKKKSPQVHSRITSKANLNWRRTHNDINKITTTSHNISKAQVIHLIQSHSRNPKPEVLRKSNAFLFAPAPRGQRRISIAAPTWPAHVAVVVAAPSPKNISTHVYTCSLEQN